jgi:ABC-type uncharacterized transport system permease subunit
VERGIVAILVSLAVMEAKGTAVGFVERRGESVKLGVEAGVAITEPLMVLEGTVPDVDDGVADGTAGLGVALEGA